MAAPGTNAIVRLDATNTQRQEYWQFTTQPGGVELVSGLGQILYVFPAFSEFVADNATLSYEIASDAKSVRVYSSSDAPRLVTVMVTGDI